MTPILKVRADYSQCPLSRLSLLWVAFDVSDTLLKGLDHFRGLGLQYPIMIFVQCALLIAAMVSRNEKTHGAAAIFLLLSRTFIALQSFRTSQ